MIYGCLAVWAIWLLVGAQAFVAQDTQAIQRQLRHQEALLRTPALRGPSPLKAKMQAQVERLRTQLTAPIRRLVVQKRGKVHKAGRDVVYTEKNMTQPLDHFDGSTNVTFEQRYFLARQWYDAGREKRGKTKDGREIVPIILYDGGETSLKGRLNVLNNGIVQILANATGGIGILLEHRYYGTSLPLRSALGPGKDWGVDQLQYLTTRQSLEDSAAFIRHVSIEGVPNDAEIRVIYYGGSYAGARSAFMRKTYPDLVWGAIASSGVVAATVDLPAYYYAVARGSNAECAQSLQRAVAAVDLAITPQPSLGSRQEAVNATQAEALTRLFGLGNASTLNDFAELLTTPLGFFQALSWLQDNEPTPWSEFCDALSNTTLIQAHREAHKDELAVLGRVPASLLGYAAYMEQQFGLFCDKGGCLSQDMDSFRHDGGVLTDEKAWQFQVCSEYGYYQVAPPIVNMTHWPPRPSGPQLVSWRMDEDWMSSYCREGYTPSATLAIPAKPRVDIPNGYGNFGIQMSRLAIIDGQHDPWRPMTLHSDEYAYGGNRDDTLDRPFKLIPNCWHHCDSDGLADPDKEPSRIQDIHRAEIAFVRHWLQQTE